MAQNNNCCVDYIKITNLDTNGEEWHTDFAIHLFNANNEIVIHHSATFEELKENIRGANLLDLLSELDSDSDPNENIELVHENNGLYFNQKWLSLEEAREMKL